MCVLFTYYSQCFYIDDAYLIAAQGEKSMKWTRWIVGLLGWLLIINGANAESACHVEYKITNQWNSGFGAEVILKNTSTSNEAWSGWQATWSMLNGQQITGLWNGQHTQSGADVTVNDANWNKNVAAGNQVSFGFNGSHQGQNEIPYDIKVNGVLCTGQSAPPEPEPLSCKVNYDIVSEWSNGFSGNITLENTGGDVYDGWTLTWDMPNGQQITGLWGGQYSQSNSTVSVNNEQWNKQVNHGQSITVGFNGSHLGTNQIPGNVSLNGVLCDGQVEPEPLDETVQCEANYTVSSQWNTGFTTDLIITNHGTAWHDWEVSWTMPYSQSLVDGWGGVYTQTGDVIRATAANWNGIIPTNKKIELGFNGTHNGENPIPIDVSVNGTRCSGQADSIQVRPQAPQQLTARLQNNTQVLLTWEDRSDNEDSFIIERRIAGQNWQSLTTLSADTTNYTDASLAVGVDYDYRVKASNSSGVSDYSNLVSAKRQDRLQIGQQMLVDNCANCHGTDGVSSSDGIPNLTGFNHTYLFDTLKNYQSETRSSTIMGRIARGYSDEHLQLMSDYLAQRPFAVATQSVDSAAVNRGRSIHDENCTVCHLNNGRDQSIAPRLAGQWKDYLYATLKGFMDDQASHIPVAMLNQLNGLEAQYGTTALSDLAEFYAANPDNETGYDNGDGDDNGNGDGNDNGGDDGTGDGGDDNGNGDGSGGTGSVPSAPTGLSLNNTDNEAVNLSWLDNSGNETGFTIQRKAPSDESWTDIAQIAADSTSYQDTTVSAGNDYDYQVSAYNDAGASNSTAVSMSLPTLLAYGAQVYQDQGCANCHGNDGKGGFTNVPLTQYNDDTFDQLLNVNTTTMPLGQPDACVGNCAYSVSRYITDVLAVADAGGQDPQACAGEPPASSRSLRLLTRFEYQNTVNDLLGLSVNLIHELPDENRVDGYDNNVAANQITGIRLEAFLNKAEELASEATTANYGQLVPCATEDNACATQFIQTFGLRAYRRPLSNDEVNQYLANFAQDAFRDAVQQTVMGMLMSPNFLYRSELGEQQADGTYQLTSYEIASSLSYLFWGSMPDDKLFQLAAADALNTPVERAIEAHRLLDDPRSREQVGNFVGQWLLSSSPYALPEKDSTVYPAYTSNVREALSQELINFFSHIALDTSGHYRDLFTSNYVLANQTLANYYGLSGASGNQFSIVSVPDGSRSGVLTLGAVLARHANSNESHPFKRGRFFFERILCHDLPEPANMGIVEAPTVDPNATTRERFAFHSETSESCYSCHQYIDGPGFGFENYDGAGQFRSQENNTTINASGILRGLESYTPSEEQSFTDLQHLGQIIADSPTASQCIAKQYYRYVNGRREGSGDSCAMDQFIQQYQANDYQLQTLLLGIVNANNFIQRRAQ